MRSRPAALRKDVRGERPKVGETVVVRSPGKLNISLAVGERDEEDFHDLATVFMAVSLYEDVAVTLSEEPGIRVQVSAQSGIGNARTQVPLGPENLVVSAVQALIEESSAPRVDLNSWGLDITITKDVPIAGGMAGASADAAATLLACHYLWRLNLSRERLMQVGRRVGPDVPFFLMGGVAMGLGRGDELTPVLNRICAHWVLIFSDQGLPTAGVFRELERLREAQESDIFVPEIDPELIAAVRNGSQEELGAYISNDLQIAALRLRPGLVTVMDAAGDMGALACVVSGSGPTVAALAADSVHAAAILDHFHALGYQAVAVHGPVPGAAVVAVQ